MLKNTLILIIIFIALLPGQSKNLQQFVEEWPSGCDTLGLEWVVYDYDSAGGRWLNQSSVGCFTNYIPASQLLMWNANLGNFPGSVWQPGDSIIAFGCWDSAFANDPVGYNNNPNHTGFFWVFSDTLTSEEPQEWQPHDTLRIIPKPIAYLQTNTPDIDTIVIKIPNPAETRRVDQTTYDIMGYELYSARYIGTPNNLADYVGYLPCQGGIGDTTTFKETEDSYLCETLYYAYKIVTRPDTTTGDASNIGYTSKYFSMNSDALALNWQGVAPGYISTYLSRNSDPISTMYIGIEQETAHDQTSTHNLLSLSPNPFSKTIHICFHKKHNSGSTKIINGVTLKIFDVAGKLIKCFSFDRLPESISVRWDGTDAHNDPVPDGVYFCCANIGATNITKKIIKLE